MTHTMLRPSKSRRVVAFAKQRCPRCLEGSIFTGWITTREECPACSLRYGREEGYFSGGMDLSFFLAAPVLAFIFLVFYQLFSSTLTLVATLFLSYAVFLPCAVPLFRYSRVLWLYLDWQLDPIYEVQPAPLPPLASRRWWMPPPRRPWTYDSLFALAQRLATVLDPAFDRTLPRRSVESVAGHEQAVWGTKQFGLVSEQAVPQPAGTILQHQSFHAYGLAREQQLTIVQEHDPAYSDPCIVVDARALPAALSEIDRVLVETYEAALLARDTLPEPIGT